VDHFLLAIRNLGITIRPKLYFGERMRMVAMGVQGQHHGHAFLHDSYPRMTAPVDATFVTLGQSKPTLQIQVVAWPIAAASASEEARLETSHYAPHLLTDRILVLQQCALQRAVKPSSFRTAARPWVQQRIHFTNCGDIPGDLLLCRHDQVPSLVDTTR